MISWASPILPGWKSLKYNSLNPPSPCFLPNPAPPQPPSLRRLAHVPTTLTVALPDRVWRHVTKGPCPLSPLPSPTLSPAHPRLCRIKGTYPPALPKWEGG